jgi:ElaB/YqjD/DUF883 family membrane-anchored ribosome-binding protein
MESMNVQAGNGNTARGVMDRVRDTAASQLSNQKNRATDGLGHLARAVRQSTQSLRDNEQDTVAHYIEQAADRIEQFSSRLRDRDLNELMRDAEKFARRQPAVFIGAAFMVGVLAVRFLKSSSAHGAGASRRFDGRTIDDRTIPSGSLTSDTATSPYSSGRL